MGNKISVEVSLDILEPKDWTDLDKELLSKAKVAAENAYAPYSGFLVGAAVLLENGVVFGANNQENVSFPAGTCAERALLNFVVGNYPKIRPLKLAIVAKRKDANNYSFVTPCGICRQAISEYEKVFGEPIEILMLNEKGNLLRASGIKELLPFGFKNF